MAFRVCGKTGVEYGVGNSIANFIGMSFTYGFGRKEIAFIIHQYSGIIYLLIDGNIVYYLQRIDNRCAAARYKKVTDAEVFPWR